MPRLFPPRTDPPVTDVPIYWFAKLERALDDGDFEAAAEAQRQLERLGVTVRFTRRAREAVADGR